uniref:Nucleoside diphosphate kinase n=2 Tax=Oryzias latipes TaxID=8090 RepID=A0A3P9L2P5_ORYLA
MRWLLRGRGSSALQSRPAGWCTRTWTAGCFVMGSAPSAAGPAAPPAKSSKVVTMSELQERTFIAIKPDGVQRGIIGEIIKRFEMKGFKLVGMKMVQASEDLLMKHYIDLKDRPFFPTLVNYMSSGPVVAMVWEGKGVVKTGRVMLGETNPADSKPGTIRGDFCIDVSKNIIHGSDSVESANTEISLWFQPEELVSYTSCAFSWLY